MMLTSDVVHLFSRLSPYRRNNVTKTLIMVSRGLAGHLTSNTGELRTRVRAVSQGGMTTEGESMGKSAK